MVENNDKAKENDRTAENDLILMEEVVLYKSGSSQVITMPSSVRKVLRLEQGDKFKVYVKIKTKEIILQKI